MADANVPETVDSAATADADARKAPVAGSDPFVKDGAAIARADPAGTPVEAATPANPKANRAKTAAMKPVSPTAIKAAKPVRKQVAPKPKSIPVTNKASSIPQLKDRIMATKTPDFAKGIQDAIADVQGKAKAAFEKGTASLGEVSEFTKGNVEALVESGKIFASGAQSLGSTYAADSRTAFEALTADVKELASAKTPADFFKLQGDMARRNFDTAIAASSKNSEALFKLVNEAFAPISGRVSLAVDKIKQAA